MSIFDHYINETFKKKVTEKNFLTEELIREANETCLYIIHEAKKVELTKEEKEYEKYLRQHLPKMNMLSVMADAKTIKSLRDKRTGDQYLTGVLYIAPATEGGVNVCVGSSGCCRIGCLNRAGNPAMAEKKILSRVRKAKELHMNPRMFFYKLKSDIANLFQFSEFVGTKLAIRLNGTSDYDFGKDLQDFIREYKAKGVVFYDYTKILPRYNKYFNGDSSNLIHHTFSRSEENDKQALKVLENGGNVAYVFYQKQNELPKYYLGYKVINGDNSDLRFLDDVDKEYDENGKPKGLIVGLSAKGSVKGRGARARAIRRSVIWNKKQDDPKYIGSKEFKKDAADYFGVKNLEELLTEPDKLKEFLDFQKPDSKLLEPDGGFEIIIDDLKKVRPEVFDPDYRP